MREDDGSPETEAEFDAHAAVYDTDLDQGLRLTGAGKAHYAEERIKLLRDLVRAGGTSSVSRVIDFGCGDGDASPMLRDILGAREVIGVDVSPGMLATARSRHPTERFELISSIPTLGAFDVAYCNGVFHHIPPRERVDAARSVRDALRVGGLFGMWENNPWNPGTRIVMRQVAFDREAIMLSPPNARALLRASGLTVIRTDHMFIFPGGVGALRSVERFVSRLPLGGQYQVLARRSS